MLQHKVNQMLFSPPFLLVALIYLCLPLCTESCECQTNNTLHLNITENDGHGSTIIINFLEGYPNDHFIFDFWDSSDRETTFDKYFELEKNLSTIGSIDREEIAKDLRDPYSPVRFEFEISYYNDYDIEEQDCKCVTLDVIDLDDNTPTFETEQKIVVFHEDNTEVGRKVDIPIAVDDDEAGNGTSVYELVDESGKFELVYKNYSGTPRVKALSLKHNSPLDYEQQPFYQLQLHAREDNESPDKDVLIILVRVIDSCDEPVTFTTSRYTPSVIEEMGYIPIVKVEATSDYNHINCPLTYEITKACRRETNHQTSNCENIAIQPLFTLDLESGQLTLLEELDRESYSEYEVTIRASDGQHSPATAMVVISVEDINDNPPVVHHEIRRIIPEKQLPGPNALGDITVTDDDAGENGTTTVYLLDNSTGIREESQTFRLIKQNEIEYRFVLNRSLDFETQREFSLIIRAQDHGINPHSVERHVLIQIEDSNDHPPEFVNLPTVKSIPENSVLNTPVITVEARDGDEGIITYELPESNATYPYQHLFQIEQEIGRILVGDVALDYENVTSYTILVVARNSENDEHLSSSAELTILLEDVNDNYPTFPKPVYEFNFEEGEINVTGGPFEATDADIGANADIRYELLDHHDKFSVDSVTGAVRTKVVFDREEQDKYTIRVRAVNVVSTTDNAVRVCDVAEVQVTVIDVNDNPPMWENTLTMVTISSDYSVGTFVIVLMATDADIGDNAEVSYKLDPSSRLFNITIDNGIIRVKANLENKIGSHNVLVTAFNTHDPEQSNVRNMTIVVEEPFSSHPTSFIGSISGVVALVIVVVILMLIVLLLVYLDKKRHSRNLEKCRSDVIDGISSPTRSILRTIPSSSVEFNGRSSSLNGKGREVKFDTNVQEYGYDNEHAVSNSSNMCVTEFTICPDSNGDESPATPPRLPSASLHRNGKLPSESFSHTSNGAPRLPSSKDGFLYTYHPHPIYEDNVSDEDSENNYSDDNSTLPDNVSNTNATLPSVRHLLRMGPSPHSTHLPPLLLTVPSHPFTHSPNHGATLTPPHHDELSIHSSSSDSLTDTPPHAHSHLSHKNQHNRQSSRGPYPKHMPDGYIPPPSSTAVAARFGTTSFLDHFQVTNFEDTSTYASADLDEELKFHPEQTPSIYRLTITSYDESQL